MYPPFCLLSQIHLYSYQGQVYISRRKCGTKYAQGWLLWPIWAEQADTPSSLIEGIKLRGETKTIWTEDDGTYLHAVCRGVSLEKSLLIAFFGSTPIAITRRTLSRLPAMQALNSSLSSSARRVDIFRSGILWCKNVGGAVLTITHAYKQQLTWGGWGYNTRSANTIQRNLQCFSDSANKISVEKDCFSWANKGFGN